MNRQARKPRKLDEQSVVVKARPPQRPVRVMLSSKCLTRIELTAEAGGKTNYALSELRERAQKILEEYTLGGQRIFAVWANEFEQPAALDVDSWEECVNRAQQSDIFISLDTSDAGWWKDDASGLGICHEELRAAVESGRGKIRVIALRSTTRPTLSKRNERAQKERDRAFDEYKTREGLQPFVSEIDSSDSLQSAAQKICSAVASAMIDLAIRGKQIIRQSRNAAGEALDWARLDLVQRDSVMVAALEKALSLRGVADAKKFESQAFALTESFSNSWAREQLGKPFLSQSTPAAALLAVACYRGFTEAQARTFFGHSAVMTVASDFGVFARDLRSHAQVVFLKNCRDSAALSSRLQSAMNWLGGYLSDYEEVRARREKLEYALGR